MHKKGSKRKKLRTLPGSAQPYFGPWKVNITLVIAIENWFLVGFQKKKDVHAPLKCIRIHRRPEKNTTSQKKNGIKVSCFTMKIAFGAPPIKLQKRQSIVFYDTLAVFSGQLVFHVLLIARILQCFSAKKARGGRVIFSFCIHFCDCFSWFSWKCRVFSMIFRHV